MSLLSDNDYPMVYYNASGDDGYPMRFVGQLYVNFKQTKTECISYKKFVDSGKQRSNMKAIIATFKQDASLEDGWVSFQLILCLGISNYDQLLPSFDIDVCQMGFNGKEILGTSACVSGLASNTLICYRLLETNILETPRVKKYVSNYDLNYLHPTTIVHIAQKPCRCLIWKNLRASDQSEYDNLKSRVRTIFNQDTFGVQKQFVEMLCGSYVEQLSLHEIVEMYYKCSGNRFPHIQKCSFQECHPRLKIGNL